MADTDNGKFGKWILGLVGGLVLLGVAVIGGILWNGNSAIVRLETQFSILSTSFNAMSAQVTASAAERYSASDAARDRAELQGMIRQLNDQLSQHSNQIAALTEYRIRSEEQNKKR